MIDRLVYRGVRIEVGTELDADGLAPGHDAQLAVLARKVFRTVEGHVLQEVSQSALTRFLQDRPHPLGNVEVGQSCLLGIVAKIVGQPVVQLTDANSRILRKRLCKRAQTDQCKACTYKKFLHDYNCYSI